MDKNETIKYLQEKYPEDLNDNYNCYWWYTCDLDGNGLKYHLLLRDKIARVDEKPLISLRAHSSDPKNLINLLIDCLVENQPFDCSSLGPNKYLNE